MTRVGKLATVGGAPNTALRISGNSGKVCDTDSVGSTGNLNLGVFAIPEIATEHSFAVAPGHPDARLDVKALIQAVFEAAHRQMAGPGHRVHTRVSCGKRGPR